MLNNPTKLSSDEILLEIVEVLVNMAWLSLQMKFMIAQLDGAKHTAIIPWNLFCVSMNGLSKSHRIASFRGLDGLIWTKHHVKGATGLNMLSNNVCVQTSWPNKWSRLLGYPVSGRTVAEPNYEQRNFIYRLSMIFNAVKAKSWSLYL